MQIRCLVLTSALCLLLLSSPAAAQFSSLNVDLQSRVPLSQLGGGGGVFGNDIWGWTDPQNGKEYAIFGLTNATSFVDISDPMQPVYLGKLPGTAGTSNNLWRDMKVYQDHVFVVADNTGNHGMQVFDLTRLRGVTSPQTFTPETTHFGFTEAHNIAINEDTGYAYVVGSNRYSRGMLFYDIRNPASPVEAGGFSGDGYTHDAQIVTYNGPDTTYVGREIAFNSNEDTVTIVDVTSKASPSLISRNGYQNDSYTHQGWLSEDHRYFFFNDEGDEINIPSTNTRTHVFDVTNLDQPVYKGFQEGTERTIDHNLYVKGNHIFEANYSSGLRILKIDDAATADLPEVAFFDTYPSNNSVSYNGAWSVYPFFESGNVIVSDQEFGLFVLKPDLIDSDLNGDGFIDCDDINELGAEIAISGSNPLYDLNGDGNVDLADRDVWLKDAGEDNIPGSRGYILGDADLNGTVDLDDFDDWNMNKFTALAEYCSGDFNADGSIDGRDFSDWNAHKFTSSVSAVPEPSLVAAAVLVMLGLGRRGLRTRA